jgi:hypothetical protein
MKALPLALVTLLALTGCNMLAVPFTISYQINRLIVRGSGRL